MGLSGGGAPLYVELAYSGVEVAVPSNFLPHSVLLSARATNTSTMITPQNESPGEGALGLSLPLGFSAIPLEVTYDYCKVVRHID